MADMLAKIRRRLAPGGDATGAIPAPAAETPLLDPEVKGVDARRLADLKAEEAGRRWRKAAEARGEIRSEEHTSELQSLMRISYAVFCLKKNKQHNTTHTLNRKLTTNQSKYNSQ